MKSFWDNRYSSEDFAYGEEPNTYLVQQLSSIAPGTILFPAEGEGRNAVYAAKLGWSAAAFDFSTEAKRKAELLAGNNNVQIDYQVSECETIEYPANSFDAIALIFVHFPPATRQICHQKLAKFLKPGGILLIEAFSKQHARFNAVNEFAGGPKDPGLLYSMEEIKSDFADFEMLELYETETDLSEGKYHSGRSAVVRMKAIKK